MSARNLPESLELVRGDVLLGTIAVKPGAADFPWYSGAFSPAPGFEPVRQLFEHELELLRANTTDDSAQWEAWEDAHAELHGPGLQLRARDRSWQADEILIHIDGGEAWWRNE